VIAVVVIIAVLVVFGNSDGDGQAIVGFHVNVNGVAIRAAFAVTTVSAIASKPSHGGWLVVYVGFELATEAKVIFVCYLCTMVPSSNRGDDDAWITMNIGVVLRFALPREKRLAWKQEERSCCEHQNRRHKFEGVGVCQVDR